MMRPNLRHRPVRRAAFAAVVLPMVACSCASHHYPASPVPAALSDREAMQAAETVLADRGTAPGIFTDAIRTEDGWLVSYKTDFDPSRTPPKEVHLVAVNTNGTAREYTFRKDR
jgi:hypothetical protein